MYKLRYGRTYPMGKFKSERIEVERDFQDEVTIEDATVILSQDVDKSHARSVAYLKAKARANANS